MESYGIEACNHRNAVTKMDVSSHSICKKSVTTCHNHLQQLVCHNAMRELTCQKNLLSNWQAVVVAKWPTVEFRRQQL